MKQNNQERKARGIPKGGFGHVLARKAKKGKEFWSAGSTSLVGRKVDSYHRDSFRPSIEN